MHRVRLAGEYLKLSCFDAFHCFCFPFKKGFPRARCTKSSEIPTAYSCPMILE
jgi:hypothetical protein